MQAQPTYSLLKIEDIVPKALFDQLKSISDTVEVERHLYSTFTLSKILLIISKRLLELSKQISL
jgi:hypothetical protein